MSQGSLDLDVYWNGAEVTGVDIRNARPEAARLLSGRTPAEALAAVPLLFSVCRHGQATAARHALAAAEGRDDPEAGIALAAEAAQEHLWRLMLDWPLLLGLEPPRELFALWYRNLAEAVARGRWDATGKAFARFFERQLAGVDAAAWLDGDGQSPNGNNTFLGGLLAALESAAQTSYTTPFLPVGLEARAYYETLAAELGSGFARKPTWHRDAAETGPYARWRQSRPVAGALARGASPIAARVLARITDLAFFALEINGRWPARWRCGACAPEPGRGFAVVETARGLLMHSVRLEQGRIADYLIVAPTEWNFHPAGAFRNGLFGLAADDAGTIERSARLLALALDPCVPYRVEVHRTDRV